MLRYKIRHDLDKSVAGLRGETAHWKNKAGGGADGRNGRKTESDGEKDGETNRNAGEANGRGRKVRREGGRKLRG